MGWTCYRNDEVFLLITFLKHSLFKILKCGNVGNILGNDSEYLENISTLQIINYSRKSKHTFHILLFSIFLFEIIINSQSWKLQYVLYSIYFHIFARKASSEQLLMVNLINKVARWENFRIFSNNYVVFFIKTNVSKQNIPRTYSSIATESNFNYHISLGLLAFPSRSFKVSENFIFFINKKFTNTYTHSYFARTSYRISMGSREIFFH